MAQFNSLIVTGGARFLNTIKGTIENSEKVGGHSTPASGNASSDQVVLGNDTRLTNSRTPTSHTHGNIQNGGTLQTNDITIASGDKIVVTDSSDSAKVARTSISFDGSTATKALTQKGTWETFGTSNLALGTTSTTALKGDTKYAGSSSAGGSATSAAKLTNTAKIGDTTTPVYFTANGVPSACTYSLNKTVPANAVFTDTTYESKTAASGGTDVSLCTTGEKYTWNNKASTDTKNTAGATNTTSKMYLIGALSQDTNPQTYSNSNVYCHGGIIDAHGFTAKYSNDSVKIDGNGVVMCCNANDVTMSYISSGSDYYGGRTVLKDPTGTFDAVSLSGRDGLVCKSDDNTTTISLQSPNGNIKCATINGHTVPSVAFGYTRRTFTSSTTLSYTGKSVTCPTGKKMIVRAYFRYVNNGPQQVLASLNSTTYGGYYSEVLDHKNGGIGGCLNFVLNSGETAYYWAKYSGAGTNYIDETTITFTES